MTVTETTYQAVKAIRSEYVAQKLGAIRNHEYPKLLAQLTAQPRLAEMLWYLQWISMQAGGLVKFCAEMYRQMPWRFGTKTMRAAKRAEYTLEEKRRIVDEMPTQHQLSQASDIDMQGEPWATWLRRGIPDTVVDDRAAYKRKEVEEWIRTWTPERMRNTCRDAGAWVLSRYLKDLCIQPDRGFSGEDLYDDSYWGSPYWLMDDPIAAVLEMMDHQAKEISNRLAMTAVAKKVFDALDYALQERVMVRIEGESRFGKTEAIRAWADMRPGLARIVTVPSSNSIAGLVRRVAEALGISFSYGTRVQSLRERIEYVLRHSSMFLILDESAFLIPQNYTSTTPPERLNWVRTEVVDRGLPLALVHTPQTFLPDVGRFVRKTGFAMQQFFGRAYRAVELPTELDRADLIAVAMIHFPELGEEYLEAVADLAELSENYLQTVEAVSKLSRYIARREGHRRITSSDIEAAASEIIPRRVAPALDSNLSAGRQPATRREPERGTERTIKPSLKAPARAVQPSGMQSSVGGNTPRFSPRGAAFEVAETDLVQVET